MALEEVGAVVGAQGGLMPAAAAADCFLHLAVGAQQALLARPRLGTAAPEGSKEAVAPLAEMGREEGVQLLSVEEEGGCWWPCQRGQGLQGAGATPMGKGRAWLVPGLGSHRAHEHTRAPAWTLFLFRQGLLSLAQRGPCQVQVGSSPL